GAAWFQDVRDRVSYRLLLGGIRPLFQRLRSRVRLAPYFQTEEEPMGGGAPSGFFHHHSAVLRRARPRLETTKWWQDDERGRHGRTGRVAGWSRRSVQGMWYSMTVPMSASVSLPGGGPIALASMK